VPILATAPDSGPANASYSERLTQCGNGVQQPRRRKAKPDLEEGSCFPTASDENHPVDMIAAEPLPQRRQPLSD
jgi:hypothetical protein